MNYDPKINGQECNLKFVRWLGSDIYKLKVVKAAVFFALIFHSAIALIQVYHICFIFSFLENMQYGSMFCGFFYPMFAMSVLLVKNNLTEEVMSLFPLWSIDTAGKEVEIKIKTQSKIITIFIAINTTIAFIAFLFFSQKLENDREFFFGLYFFHKYFPDNYWLLDSLFRTTLLAITFALLAHAYQTLYITQEIRFQLYLLCELAKNITRDYEEFDDDYLVYAEEYQKEMTTRLKCLLKRHIHLKLSYTKTLEIMSYLIIPYSLVGLLFGIAILLFFFFYEGDLDGHFPRHFCLALTGFLTFAALFTSGQTIEDETDALLSILMMPKWYTWNKKNKQTLMIFNENAITPVKIKFSENIAINYALGVNIIKAVYSMISVFSSMSRKL